MKKFFSLLHRALLRILPYKKLVILLGLDSRNYKTYYKTLHFDSTQGISDGEVDGYKDESDHQKIVELVNHLFQVVPNPRTVLDIGCGTGRYLKQMMTVHPQCQYEGIDISKEIVEKFTRVKLPGVPIHILDIETDESFYIANREKYDLICLIGIIQVLSLKRINSIFEKIYAMCKPEGVFYIQFPIETEQKKSSVGFKRYKIEELEAILKETGFFILKSGITPVLRDYAFVFGKRIPLCRS